MNLENVKRLVKQFDCERYKDLVGALIVFEKFDYRGLTQNIDYLSDRDIKVLENIYDEWMNSDISGLLDTDLKDIIDRKLEEGV